MKNLLFLSLVIIFLSSCKKDVKPIINVQFTFEASENYKTAFIEIENFRMINSDGSTGMIQNWIKTTWNYNLGINPDTGILQMNEHFETELEGVRPRFTQFLIKKVNEQSYNEVQVDYIKQVKFDEEFSLELNRTFNIEVIVDTDNAIFEDNGILKLDWNFVKARISEK